MTQTRRLYEFLASHPGASSLEIIEALHVTNATGRISDLRKKGEAEGFSILPVKRSDGHMGYHIRLTEDLTLFGVAS